MVANGSAQAAAAAPVTAAAPVAAPVPVQQTAAPPHVATVTEVEPRRQRARREKPAKPPKSEKKPKPAKVREPKPPKQPKPKRVKEPKREPRSGRRLHLSPGETVEFSARGWSGLFPAVIYVTTYRVALRRMGRTRWIPLEEVRKMQRKRTGMTVEASIEHFRFRGAAIDTTVDRLDVALFEARRPNSRRHDAGVLQAWCDRCEIWDSHTGRIRLWINRHPVLLVSVFTAAVFAIRFASPH